MKCFVETKNQEGFTLIEIILTIVLASILGSMLVSYVGTAMIRSSEPIGWLKKTLALNMTMENITNDYNNTQDIAALKASVGAEGVDQDNDYGSYHVEENRYIEFVSENEQNDTTCPYTILKVTISDTVNTGQKFTSIFTGNVPCP